jgi:endonuclease YncB( thermonuclease family)
MKKCFLWTVFLVFMAGTAFAEPLASVTGIAKIKDGDTLLIGPVEVRFSGVDAPEHDQFCTQKQQDGSTKRVAAGVLATEFLKQLAEAKPVRCDIHDNKTSYNRVIGECFVGDVNLSQQMVRGGWGLAYVRFSSAYLAEELAARQENLGIHRFKCLTPAYFRCRNYKNETASFCRKLTKDDYHRESRINQ